MDYPSFILQNILGQKGITLQKSLFKSAPALKRLGVVRLVVNGTAGKVLTGARNTAL